MRLFCCQAHSSAIVPSTIPSFSIVADSATATGLKWAAPAGGGGKVLQVVSATTSTSANITSASFTDTNITATITPTFNTSKILVIISASVHTYGNSTTTYVNSSAKLLRGATALFTNTDAFQFEGASAGTMSGIVQASFSYLDSPATTSATTYKIQAAKDTGTGVVYQQNSCTSVITLLEIGA